MGSWEECQRHSNSLSPSILFEFVNSLNLDENRSEIRLRWLYGRHASVTGTITTVVNHHSKEGYGASGTSASRGSSALPGACDSTVSPGLPHRHRWCRAIRPTPCALKRGTAARPDSRDGDNEMDGGDASHQRAAEALGRPRKASQTVRRRLRRAICTNRTPPDAGELGSHLSLTRQKALCILKTLERRLEQLKPLPPELEGHQFGDALLPKTQ